eukprot:PLAT14290.1.p2 GENE.PLAT14290.1~~PLAT14290.1.p2  ORF type:complete len:170 (+),score=38.10 PLAT14290.1:19-528(+)
MLDFFSVVLGFAVGFAVAFFMQKKEAKATTPSQPKAAAPPVEEEDDTRALFSDPPKMVFVVRKDLKMGQGKIAAQCGHATLGVYDVAKRSHPRWVRHWERYGCKKVATKVKSEEAIIELVAAARMVGVPHYVVVDAGHTQIAAGSTTVLGLGPAPQSLVDRITGDLKLL